MTTIEELAVRHYAAWAEARKQGKSHQEAIRIADEAIAVDTDKRNRERELLLAQKVDWFALDTV